METNPPRPIVLRFGVFEIDPASGELRKQGHRIRLPDQSIQILVTLLERPGQVVTRQDFRQRLWPDGTFVDFDAGLNSAISLLREALGDSARSPRFIETLPRRGYRFIGQLIDAVPDATRPVALPSVEPVAGPAPSRRSTHIRAALFLITVVAVAAWGLGALRSPDSSADAVTIDPAARDAYLQGRQILGNELEEHRSRARDLFNQAIAIDPSFAPAYEGLANYYRFTDALPPVEALSKAREYALKALELDETLADARLSLALASMWGDWDWPSADREFERSIALNPDDPESRRWYAFYLDLTGRPTLAFVQLQRLRQLAPGSPNTYYAMAYHLFLTRRYDQAIEEIRRVEALSPNDPKVFEAFSSMYVYTGDIAEALAWSERALDLWGRDPAFVLAKGIAHARAGDHAATRAVLEELQAASRARHVPPVWFATLYITLSDFERAFEWLETAYQSRDVYLLQLQVAPQFDPIRADGRYAALVRRLDFPAGAR